MNEYLDIDIAEFAIGKAPQILRTFGIGSCVVLCLYDQSRGVGALAHLMLPEKPPAETNVLRYINTAVPALLAKLAAQGSPVNKLQARIAGGANMFPALWKGERSVGTRNIAALTQILAANHIPVMEKDIGGSAGRNLEFDLETGRISVTLSN